jgi:hypothetical protein
VLTHVLRVFRDTSECPDEKPYLSSSA